MFGSYLYEQSAAQYTNRILIIDCDGLGDRIQLEKVPEPDPPMTRVFLFRAYFGFFGRLFMVRASVCVRIMLLAKSSSIYGLMSSGLPHRADPYSSP